MPPWGLHPHDLITCQRLQIPSLWGLGLQYELVGGRDTNIQSIPSIILLLDLSSQSHIILNPNLPQLCSLMPAKWVFPAYIYSTVVSFWAVSSLSWLHHIYMSRVSSLWNHRRVYVDACMHAQSCPTFFDPMNCNPAGSSVHGIFQTGILKWVAISFSRESSWPREEPTSPASLCISRWVLYHWAPREAWVFVEWWPNLGVQSSRIYTILYQQCDLTTLNPVFSSVKWD